MKRFLGLATVALLTWAIAGCGPTSQPPSSPADSYESERAKALKNPYANDFGPDTIDVSSYPPELQQTYRDLFLVKCSRCHSPARPLNSQFLEPPGSKAEKEAKVAQWRAQQPILFTDKTIWDPGPNVWERYVKRMMAKPGCNVSNIEGKKIWEFLTYDSEKRKTGANAAAWAAHRRKLLADFKTSHPDRYRELYGD